MSAPQACSTLGGKEKAPGPLELELQAVVSHMWVVGIDPRSPGNAARALNC